MPIESAHLLSIDREELRLGKYTSWAADLTPDQLKALLWMVGEYGIRAPMGDEVPGAVSDARREVGRRALVGFVKRQPISSEEAKRQIRQGLMNG